MVKENNGDKEVLIIEEDRSEKLPPRPKPLKRFVNFTKSLFEKAGTKNADAMMENGDSRKVTDKSDAKNALAILCT